MKGKRQGRRSPKRTRREQHGDEVVVERNKLSRSCLDACTAGGVDRKFRVEAGAAAGGPRGVRLAERTSRRVWLTPAGERFYAVCDRVLRDVERAERLAQGEPEAGVLEIAVASEVEAVPDALREPLVQLLVAALFRGEPVQLVGPAGQAMATPEGPGA